MSRRDEERLWELMRHQRALFNEHGLVILDRAGDEPNAQQGPCALDPAGAWHRAWQTGVNMLLIALLVLTTYTLAFHGEEIALPSHHWIIIANLIIDGFLLLDVAVAFNTSFVDRGVLERDRRKIAVHYLKGWFAVDFFSSVPLVRLIQAGHGGAFRDSTLLKAPQFLRLLKAFRVVKFLRCLRIFREQSKDASDTDEDAARIVRMAWKILTLLATLFCMTHISACVLVLIARGNTKANELDWIEHYFGLAAGEIDYPSWLGEYKHDAKAVRRFEDSRPPHLSDRPFSRYRLYVVAVYWAATTLTTVGYGDAIPQTSNEMIWSILVQFTGTCTLGFIMAQIQATVTRADKTADAIKDKLNSINAYTRYRDMPQSLKHRVRAHYTCAWQQESVWDESAILFELPDVLRSEVMHWNNSRKLHDLDIPWLSDASSEAVAALARYLVFERHNPKEPIILELHHGQSFYLVRSGQCEAVMRSEFVAKRLEVDAQIHVGFIRAGQCFAEYALLLDKEAKHPFTVRSRHGCEVYALSKDHFFEVCEQFPAVLACYARFTSDRFEASMRVCGQVCNLSLRPRAAERDEFGEFGETKYHSLVRKSRRLRRSLRSGIGKVFPAADAQVAAREDKSKRFSAFTKRIAASYESDDLCDSFLKPRIALIMKLWAKRSILRSMRRQSLADLREFFGYLPEEEEEPEDVKEDEDFSSRPASRARKSTGDLSPLPALRLSRGSTMRGNLGPKSGMNASLRGISRNASLKISPSIPRKSRSFASVEDRVVQDRLIEERSEERNLMETCRLLDNCVELFDTKDPDSKADSPRFPKAPDSPLPMPDELFPQAQPDSPLFRAPDSPVLSSARAPDSPRFTRADSPLLPSARTSSVFADAAGATRAADARDEAADLRDEAADARDEAARASPPAAFSQLFAKFQTHLDRVEAHLTHVDDQNKIKDNKIPKFQRRSPTHADSSPAGSHRFARAGEAVRAHDASEAASPAGSRRFGWAGELHQSPRPTSPRADSSQPATPAVTKSRSFRDLVTSNPKLKSVLTFAHGRVQ